MTSTDRRAFLQLLGSGALAASLPASIARALEIPAHNAKGSIQDVEHIVILMQENRSFDHYFGTLNGVRGFGDPRPVTLTTGNPVWYQPNGESYVLPFHPPVADLGLQFLQDLPHDWITTHNSWNNGQYDQWIANKGPVSMAYLTRQDIPFHYALADAFTICDAYHCSLLGPTDPNRLHMWTGWVGNDGRNGGPALDNDGTAFSWGTYPEKLQAAGISWRVYQDIGNGLGAAGHWGWDIGNPLAGNYGDNALVLFTQYQNAPGNSPLAERALTGSNANQFPGTLFDALRSDVINNLLPQVSWIAAPEAFSEHPNWPANYGAWYISQVLDALTANPDVWSKTVLFICYDENDGFFDHAVPHTPPMNASQGQSTADASLEIFNGNGTYPAGPIGLGVRVPMLVISPWTKGGYVNSQVFDHTSLIRFIELRFGTEAASLAEPNITPWRRCVSGDLASAFNFKNPNANPVTLPSTTGYAPPNGSRQPSYTPAPPAQQSMPVQEPGQRPARPLPYHFNISPSTNIATGTLSLTFQNSGKAGVGFHVRAGNGATLPWTYTVGSMEVLTGSWSVAELGGNSYDLSVYGPNGFLRRFRGGFASTNAVLLVSSLYGHHGHSLTTTITNQSTATVHIAAANAYGGQAESTTLAAGATTNIIWQLSGTANWYDIRFTTPDDATYEWRLAGHIENGRPSLTDPGIGGV